MGKVTIEDISRQTGLSRGTVSRALNNRPDISEETKQRVLEACRRLNYVPNLAARSLATGRRYAVAVLVDDLRSTFAACFLRGVVARARAERYAVHVCELSLEHDQALEHLRALARERADGVLVAAVPPPKLAARIAEIVGDRPTVAITPLPGLACDVLAPDYLEAGRLVARHVLRGSASDILYVHGDGSEDARRRREGFREACRAAGLDPDQVIVQVSPAGTGGLDRLAAVSSRLSGLRALAASDDFLALELMFLCYQAGRTPGRDIAIIGQGNEPAGARVCPTLTTVDYCAEEIGRRAMDIAVQRATKARQDAPQQTSITPLLIERHSTRMLA